MTPGPSKKRLSPSDRRVQSEQPSKRKRDNERVQTHYDMIEEPYSKFLSGLTVSENSIVYKGKDGKQHRCDDSADPDMEGSLSGRMTPEQRSEGDRDEERVQTSYHDNVEDPYSKFLSGLQLSGDSLVYEGKNGNQLRYDESTDQGRSDSDTEDSHRPPPSSGRMTPEKGREGEGGEERVQTPYHNDVEEPYNKFLSGLRLSGDSLVYEGKDGKQHRYGESADESRSDSPNDIMRPEQHSEGELSEERFQTPYHDSVDEDYTVFLSGLTTSHKGKYGN